MSPADSYDVVCLGILVADLFVSPMERLPQEGEIMMVEELSLQTGGCAANTGVDLVKLGAKVGLIGKVGRDIFGEFIVKDMTEKGLDARGIIFSESLPTSRTVILPVISQDRRYIHNFGANADFSYDDIALDMVARSKVLYVGGYFALPRLDQKALVALLSFAKRKGLTTVLDVIAPSAIGLPLIAEALPYADYIMPNDDEARLLTQKETPEEQAQVLLEAGAGTAVITLGARGALMKTRSQTLRAQAFPVQVVDPSGSGDAFDAGFIIGILHGWDLKRTLVFASAIGASCCTKLGCTPGVFTMPEAEAFLARNQLPVEVLR